MSPLFAGVRRTLQDLSGRAILHRVIPLPPRPTRETMHTETILPVPTAHLQTAIQHVKAAYHDVVTGVVAQVRPDVGRHSPLLVTVLIEPAMAPPRRRLQIYREHPRSARSTLVAVLADSESPAAPICPQTHLQHLDDWYQTQVEHFFTQLIQPHQQQHRDALGEMFDIRALSPDVRDWNRRIIYAAAAWGMAVSGIGLFSFASLIINIYFSGVFIQQGLRDMWQKRQPTELGKGALLEVLLIGSGMLGVASAASLLGVLIWKFTLMAQQQTEQQLRDVFGQLPATVAYLHDGQILIVPREQLRAGDIVVVAAGESVPVDGVVIAGTASVDQHALTGEAQPVERGTGDHVLAATLVLMGEIHVRADHLASETLVAQITTILTATKSSHMTSVSRGERMANATVVPSLLAGLVALPLRGLSSMLAVWMIPVGGILRTTGPMTMLSYLDMTARSNILVKDGRSLELLNTIDTVIFDKTGTLTHEQPTVDAVYTTGDLGEERILALAAAVEVHQTHPIAAAIRAAADARKLPVPTATATQVRLGYGVGVEIAGQPVHLGSQRYMAEWGISFPDDLVAVAADRAIQGKTTIYLAVAGVIQGAIGLAPTVRPEVPALIRALHVRGLHLVMLTGDQIAPAEALAVQLGIDQVFAEVLPAQKAEVITQLQDQGRRVLFVGDGINDSIALKQATVSVSLLGATTIATDTAQIVLMDRDLRQMTNLFELGRRFDHDMQIQFGLAVVPELLSIGGVFVFGLGIAGAYAIGYVVMLSASTYAFRTMWRQERLEPPTLETPRAHE